ncbi:MAG: hypothetical protein ACJAT2_000409 [Bacteriovoracaceae bacterium]|jgi:hypothetical protein
MQKVIILLFLVSAFSVSANERIEIAKKFEGRYELVKELANDFDEPCARELAVRYWKTDKFLDLQFVDSSLGIYTVDHSPAVRAYVENSYVYDVINKVNTSEDEEYMTTTRINTTRIEERTYKGEPGDYELRTQAYFSRNVFNGQVRFEFINKKLKRKECLYQ